MLDTQDFKSVALSKVSCALKIEATQKKIKCQIKTCILKLTRSLFHIYATIYNLLGRI